MKVLFLGTWWEEVTMEPAQPGCTACEGPDLQLVNACTLPSQIKQTSSPQQEWTGGTWTSSLGCGRNGSPLPQQPSAFHYEQAKCHDLCSSNASHKSKGSYLGTHPRSVGKYHRHFPAQVCLLQSVWTSSLAPIAPPRLSTTACACSTRCAVKAS